MLTGMSRELVYVVLVKSSIVISLPKRNKVVSRDLRLIVVLLRSSIDVVYSTTRRRVVLVVGTTSIAYVTAGIRSGVRVNLLFAYKVCLN